MNADATRVSITGARGWYLVERGMGGFLDPPGDVEHSYSFEEGPAHNPRSMMSVRGVLNDGNDWIPEPVKARASALIEAHHGECTEEWVRSVYAHFRACYSHDGIDRDASRCLIVKPNPDGVGYVVGTFGRDGLRMTGVLDRERAMEAYHALGRIVGQSLDPIAAAASLHVKLEWRAASRYVDRAGVEHETSTNWTSDRAWCELFIIIKRDKMPEADTWLESRAISAPQRVEP
jgi:hypothetical protein